MAKLIPEDLLLKIETDYGELTPRDQRAALVLVGALILFVGAGMLFVSSRALSKKESHVDNLRREIVQLISLESEYKSAQQASSSSQGRLKNNNISLFSRLQQAAQPLGLQLNDLNERRTPSKDGAVTEISVQVSLKSVSIDELDAFLEKVEGKRSDGLVKVIKMNVATRFDNAELLDVKLTVATWSLNEVEGE